MKTIISPPRETNDESLRAFFTEICDVINTRLGNIPDDSTASTTAGVVSDFNELLEVLR